ncbi:MAG: amidohydrolase family protein, partial [Alphaproteobacteria bacterium]|nr:amidohydrolase family protein [Alphaproteobacteria bacterium]
DGAVLVSPYTMYRYDASYALEVYAAHPGRFCLVKPVDPQDPAVAETVADWARTEGAVAVRIMMAYGVSKDPENVDVSRVLRAAANEGLPVNLLCWGLLDHALALAKAHPETQLVIDHLGLKQPFEPPAPPEPFAELPALLALAACENVVIKITGTCTLSHAPYPFDYIWDPLSRLFEAFGIDRCLWGTDWTRAVNLLTYEQGVEPFRRTNRLTEDERAALMGGTLQQVYGWSPRAD